jgi:hypothetical protein
LASLFFGRIIRAFFGENSTVAPLYMVISGGVFMLIAAALVTMVTDVADRNVPEEAVIAADQHEPFTVPESVQPVPSTGLSDRE